MGSEAADSLAMGSETADETEEEVLMPWLIPYLVALGLLSFCIIIGNILVLTTFIRYSPSQYRRSWDWRKTGGMLKRQYWEGVYNLKKPYLGLEMGGGIGREAVLGGRYWEGRLY